MSAVVCTAPRIAGPRHHMRYARWDILIAPRAHVEFGGR